TLMLDGSLGSSSQISTISLQGATGDAGSVLVEAQRVTLTNGAQIASVTQGSGHGGDLTIIARDSVTLDGFGRGLISSGLSTSSQPGSTGDAGSVQVEAQRVTLTNGAQMQSGTTGAGRGDNVTVMARDSVTVDGFGGGLLSLITASSSPPGT